MLFFCRFSLYCICSFLLLQTLATASLLDKYQAKGILLFGNTGDPPFIDPQQATSTIESNVLRALFEGLCVNHPTKNGVSVPGVAKSWQHNKNATRWTFHLRKNACWSDNKPLTAEDFLFSYQRMLSPKFKAKYASLLYIIKNAQAYNQGKITNFKQVGISAPDKHTLVIELETPCFFLPELTKHFTWYPVPKHAIATGSNGKLFHHRNHWTSVENMVSNGAFKLQKWRFNSVLKVTKNPYYWDRNNVALNAIHFLPIKNTYTETRMFLNEQLHITSAVPSDMISYAKKKAPRSLRLEPYLVSSFLRFNVTKKPGNNINFRKALSLAIPRQLIVQKLLKGGEKAAYALTPPFHNYQPPHIAKTDYQQAKKLLTKANLPQPIQIKFLTSDSDSSKKIVEVIASAWREKLGIKVIIDKYEFRTYLKKLSDISYDVAYGGWIGDYIDATTYLDMWKKGDGNNRTGWFSNSYEKLLQTAAITANSKQRATILQQAEQQLLLEYPITPIYWGTKKYLVHPSVEGMNPLLLGTWPFKFMSLKTVNTTNFNL